MQKKFSGIEVWVKDLEQNLGHSSPAAEIMPPLLSHGLMYNMGARQPNRIFTAREHLLVQGMPVVPEAATRFKCPFEGVLEQLSVADIKRLAGNSMAAVCIGSLIAYVVGRTHVKSELQRMKAASISADMGLRCDEDLGGTELLAAVLAMPLVAQAPCCGLGPSPQDGGCSRNILQRFGV